MSTLPYSPAPGTFAARVCTLLQRQHSEEFTATELAKKFETTSSAIPALLATCLQHMLIARRKDSIGNWLYFAGSKLAALDASVLTTATAFLAPPSEAAAPSPSATKRSASALPAFPAAPAAAPRSKTQPASIRRVGHRLPELDVSTLQVKVGKPPTGLQCQKGFTRHDPVFDRLTEAGQCIEVPVIYQHALDKAKQLYAKRNAGRRFVVRRIDDKTCGVYRVA